LADTERAFKFTIDSKLSKVELESDLNPVSA